MFPGKQMIDFIYQNEATIRLSVFLCGFSLLALWEWAKPRRGLTQVKFKRWFNNITLVVCSTVVVRIVLPTAAIGMAYLSEQQHLGLFNHFELPFLANVVISFILLDLIVFFQHVIFHVLPVMWRIHRVHHSDLDCDVTTGLRFHPVEILLSMLIKLGAIVALGIPVLSVILFEVVLNLMSMFTHSNIRLNKTLERVLRWFIVTPDMHRVHHSIRENETNSNFSFHISLWDRIFGTYMSTPQAGHEGMTIGLDQFREPDWQDIKGLMIMPFSSSVRGYAINYRDTINADELLRVNALVDEQTKYLKQAKETAEQKSRQLHEAVLNLSESESYQRMLVETIIDGFITCDYRGVIDSFNPAAERIFGYKAEEAIGKNVSILMPESAANHHDTHLARYNEAGDSHVIGIGRVVEGQRKDGTIFPVDIALSDTKIGGKQVLTAVVRDVSERVLAQQQLRAQKEQLANVLENTGDAYLTLDKDWAITYVNPVAESCLDINPDEVIGLDLRDALPDIVSMFYKMLRIAMTTHVTQESTVLYGPTMKYLEAHASPTTEGLLVSFRDITLRRKSEDELRLARETEFRNKEKIRLAIELTSYLEAIDQHALVSATDPTGKIIKINEKFCQVSGYSQKELLGKNHRIVNSGTHPKEFFANMWSTIASGDTWKGEICNRSKNGSFYWVDSTIVPVMGVDGKVERYISVRLDITERKLREVELQKAYLDLAKVNSQLDQLSRTDKLTNIANRRHFDETLLNQISQQSRQQSPITLFLCDIDYFKNYNDTYGHLAGDNCLEHVAHSIKSNFTRAGDLVARYGGEEFAVILTDIGKETALTLAERMRVNIEQLKLMHEASAVAKVITISVGVTTLVPDKNTTIAMLVEKADKALYTAKEKGRNNVQYYE